MGLLAEDWAPHLPSQRRQLLGDLEAARVDHLAPGDHVTFRGGWGQDAAILATSVVTASERLGSYLGVYLLPLRHPVPVARQLVTLSQLAPGRVIFGVGIGGDDGGEAKACGVDPRTRGRRTDEALAVLRGLLAGESVTFEGEFFRLNGVKVLPAPDPPVPLIVGGRAPAAFRRAGRFGAGWNGIWISPPRFAEAVKTAEAEAALAGRNDEGWQHALTMWCGFGATRQEARTYVAPAMETVYGAPFEAFERYSPYGTPEEVAEFTAAYLESGCHTLNIFPRAASQQAAIEGLGEVRRHLTAHGW